MRFRIIHKSLILVAAPLLLEILFVYFFYGLLHQAQRDLEFISHTKEILVVRDSVIYSWCTAAVHAMSFTVTRDEKYQIAHSQDMKDIARRFKEVQALVKGDKVQEDELKTFRHKMVKSLRDQIGLMIFSPDVRTSDVFTPKRKNPLGYTKLLADIDSRLETVVPRLNQELRRKIQLSLFAGIIANIVFALGLAVFFNRTIRQRLRNVLDNTFRLNRRQTLLPPLGGTDEVAELDESLYKAATRILELEKFKESLLLTVTDNLRHPLNSLKAHLADVVSEGGNLSQEAFSKLKRSHTHTSQLVCLVDDLLRAENLESGRIKIEISTFDVRDLLDTAAQFVEEFAQKHAVTLVIESESETVQADFDRLLQVIINLLSNAIKFSNKDSQVIVRSELLEGNVIVKIIDFGRGIPASYLDKIFNRFEQVEEADAKKKGGSGLGLAISKSIVEQQGGTITVESELGKGSTFSVKLPKQGIVQEALAPLGRDPANIALPTFRSSSGLARKGLIVVGVPLLLQILVMTALVVALNYTEHLVNLQSHSKDIILATNQINGYLIDSGADALVYNASGNKTYREAYDFAQSQALRTLAHLSDLAGSDKRRQASTARIAEAVNTLDGLRHALLDENRLDARIRDLVCDSKYDLQDIIMGAIGPIQDLVQEESQYQSQLQPQVERAKQILDLVLIVGLCISIIGSIVVALYFTKFITSRVKHVSENAQRLSRQEKLLPPLTGTDEIAQIDIAVYNTAEALARLEEFKQQMLSVVNHDLRTPLNSILGAVELISEGVYGPTDKTVAEQLELARTDTEQLISSINEFLDVQKKRYQPDAALQAAS